jgi:type I restriction-modification system DNA methylase subunit
VQRPGAHRADAHERRALSSFIWSVADLLRGDYKQSDYGKVILPFTVLNRQLILSDGEMPKLGDALESAIYYGTAEECSDALQKYKRGGTCN